MTPAADRRCDRKLMRLEGIAETAPAPYEEKAQDRMRNPITVHRSSIDRALPH
jgi:hypothetical protein